MPVLVSILISVVPTFFFALIIYWIDRYEKEPVKLLLGVFVWGALVAAGGAFIINTVLGVGVYLVTGSENLTDLFTGSIIAPLVEEGLKGLAVLIVFIFAYKEFDTLLDGIVYAGIAALGFAAVENAYYIYNYGWLENGWRGIRQLAFIRIILVGWQHPYYTAFTGIGLALARRTPNWFLKILSALGGYAVAVFTHSLHNTLAHFLNGLGGLVLGSLVDWAQIFLMMGFIAFVVYLDKKRIMVYLKDEMENGYITPQQYQIACSAVRQTGARFHALLHGKYRLTNRFYQACAELAQKKEQWEKFGEERGNAEALKAHQMEVHRLAQQLGAPPRAIEADSSPLNGS